MANLTLSDLGQEGAVSANPFKVHLPWILLGAVVAGGLAWVARGKVCGVQRWKDRKVASIKSSVSGLGSSARAAFGGKK